MRLTQIIERPSDTQRAAIRGRLTMCFAQRCKSRQRCNLDDGREVLLVLPRGQVLRSGQLLVDRAGNSVEVIAAKQAIYRVSADGPDAVLNLLKAAYHLGNRHVKVEVREQELRLEPDPVLRQMLLQLGLCVGEGVDTFEPEVGAYGGHHHHHGDDADAAGALGEELSRQAHGHHHHH